MEEVLGTALLERHRRGVRPTPAGHALFHHSGDVGRSESQKANLDALGTQLDDNDRAAIAALPKDQRFVRPPFATEWDAIG
jgi:hypothetical protein